MNSTTGTTGQATDATRGWLPASLIPLVAIAGGHFACFASPISDIGHLIDVPSGIGLGVLLLLGWRTLPAIFASNAAIQMSVGVKLPAALFLGGMDMLAVTIAALLLLKVARFKNGFTRQRDLVAFMIIAGGLLPLISGLFWALAFGMLNGAWSMFSSVVKMVWFTHASGALTLAPLTLCLGSRAERATQRKGHRTELAIVTTAAAVCSYFAWCNPLGVGRTTTTLAFLPLAFPVWAALRLGHCSATSIVTLTVFIAAWGTSTGNSMFVATGTHDADSLLFSLIVICSACSLLAATIIHERNAAELERRELEVRVRQSEKLESLGMLAGGVAHDFNNLLTPILAGADLIALSDSKPANKKLLANIKSASEQARGLCQQMLAYAGRAGIEREVIDLCKLVRDAEALVRHLADTRLTIEFEYTRSRATVEVDASQIQQVLLNLAKNAAEAMHDRSGKVIVAVRLINADEQFLHTLHGSKQLTPGIYVGLEVEDEGTGIADDVLQRVFDPFYSTKGSNRGLGLAGAIGITQAHNGGISINSSEGIGTRVTAWFPRSKRSITAHHQTPFPTSNEVRGTVMVVDDDPKVRFAARSVLERSGMTVLEADSGEAAVSVANDIDTSIDLVLLDLSMPGIDGHETCHQLHEIRPSMPVILSSGYDKNRSESSLTEHGYAAFLQKPYESGALLRRVQDALNDRKSGS